MKSYLPHLLVVLCALSGPTPARAQGRGATALEEAVRPERPFSESPLELRATTTTDGTIRLGADLGLAYLGAHRTAPSTATRPVILGQQHDGSSIEIRYDDLTVQHLASMRRGVEQGLVLPRRLPGRGPLLLEIGLPNGNASIVGATAVIRTAHAIYEYGEPRAWDREGRPLPAHLEITQHGITISVEDDSAAYPVFVDPLIRTLAQRLPIEGARNFVVAAAGTSVAVLVAERGDPALSHLYVLDRTGPTWSVSTDLGTLAGERAALTASGDWVFVGNSEPFPGVVHPFRRGVDGTWEAATDITCPYPGYARFGLALAADGDQLAVAYPTVPSSASRVIFYSRVGSDWMLASEVAIPFTNNQPDAGLVLSGDRLAVTATGRLMMLGRRSSTWTRTFDGPAASISLEGAFFGDAFVHSYAVSEGCYCPRDAFLCRFDTLGCAEVGMIVQDAAGTWTASPSTLRIGDDRPPPTEEVIQRGYQFGAAFAATADHLYIGAASFVDPTGIRGGVFEAGLSGDSTLELLSSPATPSVRAPGTEGLGRSLALIEGQLIAAADDALYIFAVESGAACTDATECATGQCVDGVCCDTACGGGETDCMACSIREGAPADGVCAPLSAAIAASRECRAATGSCDLAEHCSSVSTTCPPDVAQPDGVVCEGDTTPCDGSHACFGGACVSTPAPSCEDGDECTEDLCSDEAGGCIHAPVCALDAGADGGAPPNTAATCSVAASRPPASPYGALLFGAFLVLLIQVRRNARGVSALSAVLVWSALATSALGCTPRRDLVGTDDAPPPMPDVPLRDAGPPPIILADDVCGGTEVAPVTVSSDGRQIAYVGCGQTPPALFVVSESERLRLGDARENSIPVLSDDGAYAIWSDDTGLRIRRTIGTDPALLITPLDARDLRLIVGTRSVGLTVVALTTQGDYGSVLVAGEPFDLPPTVLAGRGHLDSITVDRDGQRVLFPYGETFGRAAFASSRPIEVLTMPNDGDHLIEGTVTSSHALARSDDGALSLRGLDDPSSGTPIATDVSSDLVVLRQGSIPALDRVYFVDHGILSAIDVNAPHAVSVIRPFDVHTMGVSPSGVLLGLGATGVESYDPDSGRATRLATTPCATGDSLRFSPDGARFAARCEATVIYGPVDGPADITPTRAEIASLGWDGRGRYVYWRSADELVRARPGVADSETILEGIDGWWALGTTEDVLVSIPSEDVRALQVIRGAGTP